MHRGCRAQNDWVRCRHHRRMLLLQCLYIISNPAKNWQPNEIILYAARARTGLSSRSCTIHGPAEHSGPCAAKRSRE